MPRCGAHNFKLVKTTNRNHNGGPCVSNILWCGMWMRGFALLICDGCWDDFMYMVGCVSKHFSVDIYCLSMSKKCCQKILSHYSLYTMPHGILHMHGPPSLIQIRYPLSILNYPHQSLGIHGLQSNTTWHIPEFTADRNPLLNL